MNFLRWLLTGEHETPIAAIDEASVRLLQQERGEFRQSLQRLSSGSRLMMAWEGVGQMREDDDAQ